MDCSVCCESINKRNKNVQCIHCNYESCTSCSKRYILSIVNDAKCMNCGKEWNREFLVDNFSYSFINGTYKKHRENIIYDRQLSMMEDTQKVIEKRKIIENVNNELIDLKDKLIEIKSKIRQTEHKKWSIVHNRVKENKEIVRFYGHCPETGCKGFINSSFKCGICEVKVCKSCKEKLIIDTKSESKEIQYKPHMCNQATLDTLAQLKKDSKPCPKCKVLIYRISGCRQFFCTQCHTCYDWNTLEIITRGVFHNPHYTEWQRRNGESSGCRNFDHEDYISPYEIQNILKKFTRKESDKIINFLRFLNHINGVELYAYRNNNYNNHDHANYLELRIDFLKGKIQEPEFKKKLQWKEKRIQKKQDIYLILDMFATTGKSIILTLIRINPTMRPLNKNIKQEKLNETMKQIDELIEYTNENLNKISLRYKNKTPFIEEITKKVRQGYTDSSIKTIKDYQILMKMGKKS